MNVSNDKEEAVRDAAAVQRGAYNYKGGREMKSISLNIEEVLRWKLSIARVGPNSDPLICSPIKFIALETL